MRLAARFLLGLLAISLASLTPVLPGESTRTVQQKARCCADMNMNAGVRCPINPGGTTSSSATCCTSPAACLLLYFGNTNAFAAGAEISGTISMNDDQVTARYQRPPVPPPRISLS